MTHRDPDNESVTNSNDPYHREWGSGSVTATIVAIVIHHRCHCDYGWHHRLRSNHGYQNVSE